ncbi:MAG: diadenylate cyclase CdaA [Oscillospiraceae bacterium]|nr:diadenylate cyclase CdaA [Oscillospiraceae bacterium]
MNSILATFWTSLISIVNDFKFVDLIDIAIVSYLIYKSINLVRETRAGQLIKGIALLVFSYAISNLLELKTMTFFLKNVFQIGIIAVVVIFQPELRRALEKVGHTSISKFTMFSSSDNMGTEWNRWSNAIEIVGDAVRDLSKTATGALIVIERRTKLGEQIETGITINAMPSVELFKNIFYPNTPLHDGAVIMRGGIIHSAACFLPKPLKEDNIDHQLGSRHRADIGMSEQSDALVIVVSEETGTVSLAENGKLKRNLTREQLIESLKNKILPEYSEEKTPKKSKIFKKK